jgi:hypothetical protein
MTREHLYVALTRARRRTTLYVPTHELPALDPDDNLDRVRNDPRMYAALEILTTILGTDTSQKSATETIRDNLASSESLATLAPRFQHALEIAVRPAYKRILRDRYKDRADTLTQSPGYARLRRAMLAAEQAGHHPARLLARAAGAGDLAALPDEQLIEVLTSRITSYLSRPGRSPSPAGPVPAWLTIPGSAAYAHSDDIPPYLRDANTVIADRINSLTEHTAAARPPWIRALREPPPDPRALASWKNCLAAIAAWRDQHGITTTEPRQLLGPRPDPGTDDEPSWRHAVAAVTTARRLTSPPRQQSIETDRRRNDRNTTHADDVNHHPSPLQTPREHQQNRQISW